MTMGEQSGHSPTPQRSPVAWWRRPVVVPAGVAVLALTILLSAFAAGLLRPVPPAQPVPGSAGGFESLTALVEQVTEPAERARLETERLRLLDQRAVQASDLRIRWLTTMVQAVGLLGIASGSVIAWRQLQHNRGQLQETLKAGERERALIRSAQLAERFTRAVDQLGKSGAEHLDVRLGGIYALEQIAKEDLAEGDPVYRGTVSEVLTAFVRAHAPWPPPPESSYGPDTPTDELPELQTRAADVQAAMTVLGRPPEGHQPGRLDLHSADLRHANLAGANLESAHLFWVHLEGASLFWVHLEDARLFGAQLEGASLLLAHLERAFLAGANLERANLFGAHLERAVLAGANLEDADLTGANLSGALSGAHADQLTRWPDGFKPADHGVIVWNGDTAGADA